MMKLISLQCIMMKSVHRKDILQLTLNGEIDSVYISYIDKEDVIHALNYYSNRVFEVIDRPVFVFDKYNGYNLFSCEINLYDKDATACIFYCSSHDYIENELKINGFMKIITIEQYNDLFEIITEMSSVIISGFDMFKKIKDKLKNILIKAGCDCVLIETSV